VWRPIPDRDKQRCGSGGTEVRKLASVDVGICGKPYGVDTVPVIECQRRQIPGARASDVKAGRADTLQSSADIGVITSGLLLYFAQRRQRNRRMEIVGNFVVVVEIGKISTARSSRAFRRPS